MWELEEAAASRLLPTVRADFHVGEGPDLVALSSELRRRELEAHSLRVILAGVSPTTALPHELVAWLASRSVLDIERVVSEVSNGKRALATVPHRPLDHRRGRVLSVFPGNPLPLTMGARQRAFRLILALAREGIDVEVLVSGTVPEFCAAEAVLRQICPRVHHYRNQKRKLPPSGYWRQEIEKRWRLLHGLPGAGPALFAENLFKKATPSAKRRLRHLVESGRFDTVIVNYAWFEPVRDFVPERVRRSIQWICDSHDVQFVRNATIDRGERRVLPRRGRDRKLEIAALQSFDRVLAISPSDRDVLEDTIGARRVTLVPTGFDYAMATPEPISAENPRFGFIGTDMHANIAALKLLASEWWPQIRKRWPSATLILAGTIAKRREAEEFTARHPEVARWGLVRDLSVFYRAIDVLLNPVLVQGGLNFKSVEALMAGKILVTTARGARCLGDPDLAVMVERSEELVPRLLGAIARGQDLDDRRDAQRRAAALFSDAAAYKPLFELVRQRPSKAQSAVGVPNRAKRILIQCGDLWENKQRILGLAKGLQARGHHPIVLVYSRPSVMHLLVEGIDAVALYDFEESPWERRRRELRIRRNSRIDSTYRGLDLEDIAFVERLKDPDRFRGAHLRGTVRKITRHIDRIWRVLESVHPDALFIWNGHTGYVANILRHIARTRDLPTYFMERSIFSDGVFIDPRGVNAFSSLADRTMDEIRIHPSSQREPTRARNPSTALDPSRDPESTQDARPIAFVPLQVTADTNLLLHSPRLDAMQALVDLVADRFVAPNARVVVRPHPEEVEQRAPLELPAGTELRQEGSPAEWIARAESVVTINSTMGLEALLAGKPVLALGNSVFGGKGLDQGEPVAPEDVEAFFRHLVNHHFGLPESFPSALEQDFPLIEPSGWSRFANYLGEDPARIREAWKERCRKFREFLPSSGNVIVRATLPQEARLRLTYRSNPQVCDDWLERRAREVFGLNEGTQVQIELRIDNACDGAVAVESDGIELSELDSYMLPKAPSPSYPRESDSH